MDSADKEMGNVYEGPDSKYFRVAGVKPDIYCNYSFNRCSTKAGYCFQK